MTRHFQSRRTSLFVRDTISSRRCFCVCYPEPAEGHIEGCHVAFCADVIHKDQTNDCGCLMQLGGTMHRQDVPIQTRHRGSARHPLALVRLTRGLPRVRMRKETSARLETIWKACPATESLRALNDVTAWRRLKRRILRIAWFLWRGTLVAGAPA